MRPLALLAAALVAVLCLGGPAASGRGIDSPRSDRMWDPQCSVLRFIPQALHAGIRDGTNATPLDPYIQAALDDVSPAPADTQPYPKAHTGGRVCFPSGDYLVTSEIGSDGDGVELVGEGVSTRLLLEDAGGLRFGTYDPRTGKQGAGSHNPKHVAVRDMYLLARPGHLAGALVWVPMSYHFVLDGVRIATNEATNPITGLYLAAFQYVEIRNATIVVNAYPIHLVSVAAPDRYEAHVRITGSQLILKGNVRQGGNAALHVEMEWGAIDPIRDFLVERTLLAAFTRDRAERNTIGLKITNPNYSAALNGTFLATMFEQTEVLVDATTYARGDTSHINFIGSDFLGKRDVTRTGWKGNPFRSRPYFEGCMFANMADGIDQPDPSVGPANNAVGITGAMFSAAEWVRYNGVERPFQSLPAFRGGGSARVVDGAAILHHLIATPARVRLTSGDADHVVSVAGRDGERITVGVRRLDGTPDPDTPITVYWEAAL